MADKQGGCRLAIRPGYRNADPGIGHRGGKTLRAVEDSQPKRAGPSQLRVGFADRGRDHDSVGLPQVGRVVAHVDDGSSAGEVIEYGRRLGIGSLHCYPAFQHHPRDPGHARSPDGDEVHRPEVPIRWNLKREVKSVVGQGHFRA